MHMINLNHQMFTNIYAPQLAHGDSMMFGLPRPGSLAKQGSIGGLMGKRVAREEDNYGDAFGSAQSGLSGGNLVKPKPKSNNLPSSSVRIGNSITQQSPG